MRSIVPQESPAWLKLNGAALAIAVILAASGCSKAPKSVLPTIAPADAAAKALETYDANKDGKIADDEFQACPSLVAGLDRVDKNRDRAVDKSEVEQRFAQYEGMADIVGFDLQIFSGRQPLDGATVTFTPDAFMGEGQQSYTGTSKDGVCNLHGEEVNIPGVPTGFYKVHIVHQPTSADVTLGCEVASDAPNANRLTFDVAAKTNPPASRGG